MAVNDKAEFKYAVREIAVKAPKLANPYDRVRCAQWVKTLSELPEDELETSHLRNEYVQLLRIHVRHGHLSGLFKNPPPEPNRLGPLAEELGNMIVKKIPDLPRIGPLAPIMEHRSPDGRAYVSAKQMSGGVFCYMAVTPEPFD